MEENTVNTAVETTEKAARADKKTAKHEKKPSFFKGLKKEYKKIVFADKETVAKQTVAVVIMSIFIGVLIGVLDMVMKFGLTNVILEEVMNTSSVNQDIKRMIDEKIGRASCRERV